MSNTKIKTVAGVEFNYPISSAEDRQRLREEAEEQLSTIRHLVNATLGYVKHCEEDYESTTAETNCAFWDIIAQLKIIKQYADNTQALISESCKG